MPATQTTTPTKPSSPFHQTLQQEYNKLTDLKVGQLGGTILNDFAILHPEELYDGTENLGRLIREELTRGRDELDGVYLNFASVLVRHSVVRDNPFSVLALLCRAACLVAYMKKAQLPSSH